MIDLLRFAFGLVARRGRAELLAENAILRQQLIAARAQDPRTDASATVATFHDGVFCGAAVPTPRWVQRGSADNLRGPGASGEGEVMIALPCAAARVLLANPDSQQSARYLPSIVRRAATLSALGFGTGVTPCAGLLPALSPGQVGEAQCLELRFAPPEDSARIDKDLSPLSRRIPMGRTEPIAPLESLLDAVTILHGWRVTSIRGHAE
jgi:hypothetical protein